MSSPSSHSHQHPPIRKIILDTNIVMDMLHFADPHCRPLAAAIAAGHLQCISDTDCLNELARVTGYPAFQLDSAAQAALQIRYRQMIALCDPSTEECYVLPRCGDPDDQKFLILAARCQADLLITRDKLLLKLKHHRKNPPPCPIMTAEAACSLFGW